MKENDNSKGLNHAEFQKEIISMRNLSLGHLGKLLHKMKQNKIDIIDVSVILKPLSNDPNEIKNYYEILQKMKVYGYIEFNNPNTITELNNNLQDLYKYLKI